jgi:hypothetical protein
VHVERFGLHVEELGGGAETAELPVNLDRCRTVGHQDAHRSKRLKTAQQLLPAGNVEFRDAISRERSNDIDF